MIEIKSLHQIPRNRIIQAFLAAFADYAISFNASAIEALLTRRGFQEALSYGAFEHDTIVAFACNGYGTLDNRPSAYDTGTGTLPEYRGRGLANRLFEHLLPALSHQGIAQYVLEVLSDNTPAIKVYKKQGFEVSREFTCHVQSITEVHTIIHPTADTLIREISIDSLKEATSFCDFVPSWQNNLESIARAGSQLFALGAFHKDMLVGYVVADKHQGDLTQIAVKKEYRQNGIGSLLFNAFLTRNKTAKVKVLNVESNCNSLIDFLLHRKMPVASRQLEMIRSLHDFH